MIDKKKEIKKKASRQPRDLMQAPYRCGNRNKLEPTHDPA